MEVLGGLVTGHSKLGEEGGGRREAGRRREGRKLGRGRLNNSSSSLLSSLREGSSKAACILARSVSCFSDGIAVKVW